jgi:hypothetical protein
MIQVFMDPPRRWLPGRKACCASAMVVLACTSTACSLATDLDALGSGAAGASGSASTSSAGGEGGSSSSTTSMSMSGSVSSTSSGASGGGGGTSGATYREAVLVDLPHAYWRLGEARGAAVAVDEMGDHPASYVGPVKLGSPGAIAADSDTSMLLGEPDNGRGVNGGSEFDFVGLAPMTVEVWIRPDLADSAFRRIVTKEAGGNRPQQGWQLWLHENGIGFGRFGGDNGDSVYAPPPLLGEYHHVVITFDGVDMSIYLNGAIFEITASDELLIDLQMPLMIGASSDLYSGFVGSIDEVAIYEHALTPERVNAHYQAGLAP